MPALDTLVHALGPQGFDLAPGPGLFLHARRHPGLADWSALTGWQPWRQHATAWESDGRPRIGAPSGHWPLVLALPGKSRDETLATFAIAHDALEPGGTLVTALANDSGAARFEKQLAAAAGNIASIQKNKCRAFLARLDAPWHADTLAAWRALIEPSPVANTSFHTCPGIFSAGRIDPGSTLLAEHMPPSLHGRVADLGAGWGFLSHAILTRCPRVSTLDLFEADVRALDLARENLAQKIHNLPRCRVGFHWHDVSAGLPHPGGYDAIIMNPPFHEGRRTDVPLGESFLAAAAAALRPGGTLIMVANRQLPYEAALTRLGMPPAVRHQNEIYKILTARR